MTKRLIRKIHQEIAEIETGKASPGRVWELKPDGKGGFIRTQLSARHYQRARAQEWEKDTAVRARRKLGLTQKEFAALLGISIKTLHHWEQGRRRPTGAARVLIRIASMAPEVVLKAA